MVVSKEHAILAVKVMQLEDSQAYWIDPSGKTMAVQDNHANKIRQMCVGYLVNENQLNELFNSGGDDAIITYFVEKGWVRIRFMTGHYYLTVNKLNTNTKDLIRSWALCILEIHPEHKNKDVYTEETSSNLGYSEKLIDIADYYA